MRTSLNSADCRLLLKDVTGKIASLPPSEREPLIHKGTHYCELLPAEHEPSEAYIRQYYAGLRTWGRQTAEAVRAVSEKILALKGENVFIVSLARAGTPVGVLIKRFLKRFHGIDCAHYSVSIIRGRGIDRNAMKYILARHSAKNIQFVDGWTGKGAITRQLREALTEFPEVDGRLAVLADPARLCEIYGTRDDIFIPCSCLNSIVSGLFSRTVLRSDLISDGDFHGVSYFGELEKFDKTYEFIAAIEREMALLSPFCDFECEPPDGAGFEETRQIAQKFDVSDINLVKPSIGEATRVLLRRVPKTILVKSLESPLTKHLTQLAAEKSVPVQEYPLKCYEAVGIIDN
ncbi:MAG: cysteine protease StiP family protein [Lachnospiraceae bacterium]|nr:cysteine protease StiP family protein [Ruminococcus sp.]MCM1275963.1 cysteine protease StiP family protein [Lachnospiraceae bacterium]